MRMDKLEQDVVSELTVRGTTLSSGRQLFIVINRTSKVMDELGIDALSRVQLNYQDKVTYADVLITDDSKEIAPEEVILSENVRTLLGMPKDGDRIQLRRQGNLASFAAVRGKMFGKPFKREEMLAIIKDIASHAYGDAQITSFITACAGGRLDRDEITYLTDAMVKVGHTIEWNSDIVVDKHCIGGLAGNRTTPIAVAIVAAFGLNIPKTSSRAITSPAGTADVMEVLTNVSLDFHDIKRITEQEHGCLVWGGSSDLSPADDIIINVERLLDIDSEGQMIASVTSKKIAAGSTHVVIDIPVGPSAKVRSRDKAERLKEVFEYVGEQLGTKIKVIITDGTQPIGRGIGPALEAKDVVDVLQNKPDAPQDLRKKSLELSGTILEFSGKVAAGEGLKTATEILESGKAWEKLQAIFKAQGGIREIPTAAYTYDQVASKSGKVVDMDNRKISQAAKLAGAPEGKASGLELFCHLGDEIQEGKTLLYRVHSDTRGGLQAALELLNEHPIYIIE